jgi:hypothetical protein
MKNSKHETLNSKQTQNYKLETQNISFKILVSDLGFI